MTKRSAPTEPAELDGKDFIALGRLSDRGDNTLAVAGETCEQVPAASLRLLLTSGKIAPKDIAHLRTFRQPVAEGE